MNDHKILFKCIFGSHLYGTNTEDSDQDFKAIYIPPAKNIILGTVKDAINTTTKNGDRVKNNKDDVELEIFSLQKYLKLLAQGQMVAIDMFFAPNMYRDEVWDVIQQNKNKLINRKISSFVGYCRTQANKYGIKGSRVSASESIANLLDASLEKYGHQEKLETIAGQLEDFVSKFEHSSIVKVEQGNGTFIDHLEVCNKKASYKATIKSARDIFRKIYEEYGVRAQQARNNENVDWKACSHAVRVGTQAIELLEAGHIKFPLYNAEHLLEIKLGKLPFNVVGEEIENLLVKVEQAGQNSKLPEDSDYDWIDNFVYRTYINSLS